MPRILLLARDPGGANTILALVTALQDKGYELLLYGKDAALNRYRHFGLEGQDISLAAGVIDVDFWQERLDIDQPDFIITGTSGDDFSERYLWEAARSKGVPSFAILDQWINFGLRFSPYNLNEKDEYERKRQHPYLPDHIMVMDEEARQDMIQAGIPADRVLVSGQPYFDLIARQCGQDNSRLIMETKAALQVKADEYVVVFVSESISQDYRVEPGDEPYWGYDEISILTEVVQALIPLGREAAIHLLIKKHPLERSDNYLKILNSTDCGNLRYQVVEGNLDPWSVILAADLVCGMSSMLLLESILLGKPTLSVQIGLSRDNPLVLDKKGVLASILDRDGLERSLRDIIKGKVIPDYNCSFQTGAIDKVIQLMEECLCQS